MSDDVLKTVQEYQERVITSLRLTNWSIKNEPRR
jgi:hypothetical protein